MYVAEFDQMDDFERDLREALLRQPAPPGLKRAVMERRRRERSQQRQRVVWFERLAASLVLAAVVGGAAFWRSTEEHRRGEEAKRQVFTALRITNRVLDHMNAQLQELEQR
jgi:anti-sigma factor RsiW